MKMLTRFFRDDQSGNATLEFVFAFPVVFTMFLMSFESGMVSMRHFSLERGVDLAVRELRIGTMSTPTRDALRAAICQNATLIPDCTEQLEIELLRRDLRTWTALPTGFTCVDDGESGTTSGTFTNGTNNQLMILRACARFTPLLPTTGLGRAIVDAHEAGGGSGTARYALTAMRAYVVEPLPVTP